MADEATPLTVGDGEDLAVANLVHALQDLRAELAALAFPLQTVTAAAARADRASSLDQLDDYLLPRLSAQGAPLLVVVGGSTGAGKSTLVNSILGAHVTTPGALRPTTRSPVLVHHPLDAAWFGPDRVFPHLFREPAAAGQDTPAQVGSDATLRLVAADALPRGLALLDAPDVDSVVAENRELAAQLFAAADLWLFVTTAARYADAVPWALLHEGAMRRAQVALVIDRVDPGAEAVADDLRRMLAERGLGDAPVFVIAESALVDGLLPEPAVAPISRWLTEIGTDPQFRDAIIVATRDGIVDALAGRALALAEAADAQDQAKAGLGRAVAQAYAQAEFEVSRTTSDGSMLRGEVLTSWQSFVGTGEFMRGVERRIGLLRDKFQGALRGRPSPAPKVAVAISQHLEAIVVDAADHAAEQVFLSWQADTAGAALNLPLDMSRSSQSLRADLAEQIRAWQGDVLGLVTDLGSDKRGRARVLALGVNGVGAALMIVVFASTGGLTGAEVGIAGGSVLLAQRLLEGVFGDDAVRALARDAHVLLDERVHQLLNRDAQRFTDLLDTIQVEPGAGSRLRAVAGAVEHAAAREQQERSHAVFGAAERDSAQLGAGHLRGATLVAKVADGLSVAGDHPSARKGLFARLRRRRADATRPEPGPIA